MSGGAGGWVGRLDALAHRLRCAPGWLCDLMDHRLGLSWAEIRRAR